MSEQVSQLQEVICNCSCGCEAIDLCKPCNWCMNGEHYTIWLPKPNYQTLRRLSQIFVWKKSINYFYINGQRVYTKKDDVPSCIVCGQYVKYPINHHHGFFTSLVGGLCHRPQCYRLAKKYDICTNQSGIHNYQKFIWHMSNKRKLEKELICKDCNKKVITKLEQQDSHVLLFRIKNPITPNLKYGRITISGKFRHFILKSYNYRCADCGATKDETILHIDHIIPISKGGSNELWNLQVLCKTCNLSKHTDSWEAGR